MHTIFRVLSSQYSRRLLSILAQPQYNKHLQKISDVYYQRRLLSFVTSVSLQFLTIFFFTKIFSELSKKKC